MDEITNNNITWNTTASTSDSATLTFNTAGTDTTWFPYYVESTWMPYQCERYYPAFHLLKSYGVNKKRPSKTSKIFKKIKNTFILKIR